ncbi:MAG: gamma carbonic anhydrase family protein [Oscillospiraceae bacterium]
MRELKQPVIAPDAHVKAGAVIVGDVQVGSRSSIWHNVVIRGDLGAIKIGQRTSVQDCSVLHSEDYLPTMVIGDDVTVGHACILHGCTIGNASMVGMGSIVMNGARIGEYCIVGAGSLVTQDAVIPDGMMAFGRPAKAVRPVTDAERQFLIDHAREYAELGEETPD